MDALTGLFEAGGLLHGSIPLPYRIADVLNSLILCYAGISGLRAYRADRGAADARYWMLAGVGMLYLALDEAQSVHERIGKALWHHGWQAPAPFSHNDDALLFMIALVGLAVTAMYLRALLTHPRAARLLQAGMGVTGLVIVLDIFAIWIVVEEAMELGAALLLAAAFATRLHRQEGIEAEPVGTAVLVPIDLGPPPEQPAGL